MRAASSYLNAVGNIAVSTQNTRLTRKAIFSSTMITRYLNMYNITLVTVTRLHLTNLHLSLLSLS